MSEDLSTPIAINHFKQMGYKIGPAGLGYDFTVEKDGVIRTVEAKSYPAILPQQIKRLKEGGLLAHVTRPLKVEILTINDIEIGEPCLFRYRVKTHD
jgi:hypothetical protein